MGREGDDHLYGSTAADILLGGSNNDTVHGGGGNDIILGDAYLEPRRISHAMNDLNITTEYTWNSTSNSYVPKTAGGFTLYGSATFQWESSFSASDYQITPGRKMGSGLSLSHPP
jgi:Ca2+-binding RTX toxin-like protein